MIYQFPFAFYEIVNSRCNVGQNAQGLFCGRQKLFADACLKGVPRGSQEIELSAIVVHADSGDFLRRARILGNVLTEFFPRLVGHIGNGKQTLHAAHSGERIGGDLRFFRVAPKLLESLAQLVQKFQQRFRFPFGVSESVSGVIHGNAQFFHEVFSVLYAARKPGQQGIERGSGDGGFNAIVSHSRESGPHVLNGIAEVSRRALTGFQSAAQLRDVSRGTGSGLRQHVGEFPGVLRAG